MPGAVPLRRQIGQRGRRKLAHQRLALGRILGQCSQLLVQPLAAFADDVAVQAGPVVADVAGRRGIGWRTAAQQRPHHIQADQNGCSNQQPEKEGRG